MEPRHGRRGQNVGFESTWGALARKREAWYTNCEVSLEPKKTWEAPLARKNELRSVVSGGKDWIMGKCV